MMKANLATAVFLLAAFACGGEPPEPADLAARCLPYPRTADDGGEGLSAEELIQGDNGPHIEGEVGDAAAVKSSERVSDESRINRGGDIYFISFTVDGRVVTLAHADVSGEGPTGDGLYWSVDEFAETATNFPYAPDAPGAKWFHANLDADGAQESRDCLTG